jgi:hypothetical protein
MPTPGDLLLDLVACAHHEVLLIAPFIKHPALSRVLQAVPEHVRVRCVTRWDPAEIAAGVSDLEVWDLVRQRPDTELRLRMGLHAKLYQADQRCLVGSANLTGTALGWVQPANLELLLETRADKARVRELEAELKRTSVPASKSMYDAMRRSVDSLRAIQNSGKAPGPEVTSGATSATIGSWLPTCRAPGRLYSAYRHREDRMIASAYADARRDLEVLRPPANLNREAFTAYVTALLEQHPVIRLLDDFVVTPRSPGEIHALLEANGVLPEGTTAEEAWDSLKLWLLTYFPDRYRAKPPQETELFVRGTLLI